MKDHKLKTVSGAQVAENQHALTAGPRGPMLLQDLWFLEKLAHFDREVIPERRMHAKGSGAFGTFTTTHDVTKYTKAKIFSEVGKKTDMFARFSTVAGERGAADAERDIRGFALKFYTEDGNWDLVGNNTPVFFIRDPLKFPDLNHAIKRDPKTNMRSPQNNWDFWTLLPESLHQVTITMSDRGIPLSYRYMDGFGSHAYSLYNKNNELFYVKFHLKTEQGLKYMTDEEADAIIAKDRESFQRDLFYAIKSGDYPKWKLYFQIMTLEESKHREVNPFDLVRTWSEDEFPLIPVGEMELNRNPENYFQDVEQVAFCPSNIVQGIGLSPDKMLQGRIFSYKDAQMYRLGVNHQSIPVNAPTTPVPYYHRDGQMRVDGNFGATKGYQPNSYGLWQEFKGYGEPPLELHGDAYHYNPSWDKYDNVYEEPGQLYRSMTEEEKARLIGNTMRSISPTTENIKYRHASQCYKADKEYGTRLAKALGLEMSVVVELSEMSEEDRKKATIQAK